MGVNVLGGSGQQRWTFWLLIVAVAVICVYLFLLDGRSGRSVGT
jgi:hypothetical protein